MESEYKFLQGTDGIRGRIKHSCSGDTSNPLQYFLNEGYLTPAFFELYTFAYGKLLQSLEIAKKGDKIVIGWDPRDSTGSFNQAAIEGLLKSGLDVISVGILPTPAIPTYMQFVEAAGAVVLTASHNPSDQNGIKLFHGQTGLKFLPFDDDLLSQKIFELQNVQLSELELKGNQEDHASIAKQFFIETCSNSINSWVADISFEDTILIIDASNGAVAGVAKDVFTQFDFKEVVFTNIDGNINENCGVADIEGREFIFEEEVTQEGGIFSQYETMVQLFQVASQSDAVRFGKDKLVGLVFDGDGDRCYRLDYLPEERRVAVSSGDYLGIHQARYIFNKGVENKPYFVNTVESDLNTAITAQGIGYESVITGVGDKWILKNAIADYIETHVDSDYKDFVKLRGAIKHLRESEEASGFQISSLWKEYKAVTEFDQSIDRLRFRLGVEESGHSITPGIYYNKSKANVFFAGNGIKSGLNSLVAIQKNTENEPDNGIQQIKEPFPTGINNTLYVYYVDKSRILPGNPFREELISFLKDTTQEILGSEFTYEMIEFPEEKPLIYCRIFKDASVIGAVFIRNSGTEDKSAIYLRGRKEYLDLLMQISDPVHMFMMAHLKNPENEFTNLEIKILKEVQSGKTKSDIARSYENYPIERIFKEIEFKEKLLERKKSTIVLSGKGEAYLKSNA